MTGERRIRSARSLPSKDRSKARPQGGYALLMAVFMVATLFLLAMMALPNVLLEGRREREREVIWRGNQYVRAVRLYYQKNGRYPQTLEDLGKASQTGTHFLRKNYTDLNNSLDGSWRPIYVSQSGQLIGSVRYHTLQEMALMLGQQVNRAMAGAAGANSTGQTGASAQNAAAMAQGATQGGAINGSAPPGAPSDAGSQTQGNGQQGLQAQNGQPQSTGQGQPAQNSGFAFSGFGPSGFGSSGAGTSASSGFGSSSQPQSLAPLEPVSGPVLGGSLIGVGGKVKAPSVVFYQGGKRDYEWEFIYNPLTNTMVQIPGAGVNTGTGAAGAPGANQPSSPFAPTSPMGGTGMGGPGASQALPPGATATQ